MSKPLPVPMVLDDRAAWFEAANRGMDALIARNFSFTADDLRDMIPSPSNPNWVGAVFTAYQAKGLIRYVQHERSRSRSRRGGAVARWTAVKQRG